MPSSTGEAQTTAPVSGGGGRSSSSGWPQPLARAAQGQSSRGVLGRLCQTRRVGRLERRREVSATVKAAPVPEAGRLGLVSSGVDHRWLGIGRAARFSVFGVRCSAFSVQFWAGGVREPPSQADGRGDSNHWMDVVLAGEPVARRWDRLAVGLLLTDVGRAAERRRLHGLELIGG
jgi:hypothetical protein